MITASLFEQNFPTQGKFRKTNVFHELDFRTSVKSRRDFRALDMNVKCSRFFWMSQIFQAFLVLVYFSWHLYIKETAVSTPLVAIV